jgi:hypothetical protein
MKTLSGVYAIRNTDTMERISDSKTEAWKKIWLYPAKRISKDASADGVSVGKRVLNGDTISVGEFTEGEPATPDDLELDSGPVLYEVPPGGEPKLLRDVIIQGAQGDGVYFKYWPA